MKISKIKIIYGRSSRKKELGCLDYSKEKLKGI
jgi:hypothetical protein